MKENIANFEAANPEIKMNLSVVRIGHFTHGIGSAPKRCITSLEVDLFVEQAKKALRFAGGDQPVVGYRQALRATKIADEILSKGRERV